MNAGRAFQLFILSMFLMPGIALATFTPNPGGVSETVNIGTSLSVSINLEGDPSTYYDLSFQSGGWVGPPFGDLYTYDAFCSFTPPILGPTGTDCTLFVDIGGVGGASTLRPARSLGQQGLAGEISAANVNLPAGVYNDTITLNYSTSSNISGPFTPQTIVIPVTITVVDPNDLDSDGVVNGSDLCPNTPSESRSFGSHHGDRHRNNDGLGGKRARSFEIGRCLVVQGDGVVVHTGGGSDIGCRYLTRQSLLPQGPGGTQRGNLSNASNVYLQHATIGWTE